VSLMDGMVRAEPDGDAGSLLAYVGTFSPYFSPPLVLPFFFG